MHAADFLKAGTVVLASATAAAADFIPKEIIEYGVSGFIVYVSFRIWKEAQNQSDKSIQTILSITKDFQESIEELSESNSEAIGKIVETMSRQHAEILRKLDETGSRRR